MANKKEMTFIDHLDELRKHLIRVIVAIIILMALCFSLKRFLFPYLIFAPQSEHFLSYKALCYLSQLFSNGNACNNDYSFEIVNLSMTGQFLMHLKVSLYAGLILAFPYILYEAWLFIKPGLYPNEKKTSIYFLIYGSSLFLSGVLFSYFIVSPISMQFLTNYTLSPEIKNTISLESYIGFLSSLTFAGGIMFELPVVIYFLAKAGLVTDKTLKSFRKHSIIIILFISALITPPDISSQLILSLPLLLLYEISIIIAKRISKES